MRRALLFLALLVVAGCQLVLGIEDRRVGASCPSDSPTSGPRVRLANVAIGDQKIAACLTPLGGGSVLRLPRDRTGCPSGLSYSEVSAPVTVSPGDYLARVVLASAGCDASPMFERQVTLGEKGNTLMWAGGGGRDPELYGYFESEPFPEGMLLRLIHASPDAGPLDFGLVDANGLPATLTTVKAPSIEFSQSLPLNPADLNGYLVDQGLFPLSYGVADAGETEARSVSFLERVKLRNHAVTIFAIGGSGGLRPENLLCDEGVVENGLTSCNVGQVVEPSFEIFTATLAGLLLPYAEERSDALAAQIAGFESDVVCLEEVWPESTKAAIAAAAVEAYPYQHSVDYDVDTPFSNAQGLDGDVPPPRSEPYCSSDEEKQALETFLKCIRDKCAKPASDDGLLQDMACATTTCVAAAGGMVNHVDCGVCATYMLVGVTIAETRQLCTVVNEPFVFQGASGVLLLSRFPLEEPSSFLAPSTLIRREILHARVRHPTGAAADVFCGYSAPIPAFPGYSGVYGAGATGADAWRNERKLFFQRLTEIVNATQRAPRSVVMGTFGTSPTGESFAAVEPADYTALVEQFPLAAPADFVPSCTVCEGSPLVDIDPAFGDFVMYRGDAAPLSAEITRQELLVQVEDALGESLSVPLSGHYGFRSRLRIFP